MRRPQGYAIWSGPDGNDLERDTFTCNHCNNIVIVRPQQDPSEMGGFCRMCMKHICGPCADKMAITLTCLPFEKKLDALERRNKLLQ